MKQSFDLLEKKVESLYKNPDEFKNWLATQMNFNQYSAMNRLFIYFQNPEARYVASYKKWIDLGFPVVKSGKINVLCPVFLNGFIAENGKWKHIKTATEDEKRKIKIGELKTKKLLHDFKHSPVFDITCTNATEEDLVKILQKTNKIEYPINPEVILESLMEYTGIEVNKMNVYEDIYIIVNTYVQDLVEEYGDFDENNIDIIREAVTFIVLNQLAIDTTLFEFKAIKSLNYQADFEVLNKMNAKICTGSEYVINELSKAFI